MWVKTILAVTAFPRALEMHTRGGVVCGGGVGDGTGLAGEGTVAAQEFTADGEFVGVVDVGAGGDAVAGAWNINSIAQVEKGTDQNSPNTRATRSQHRK